jgi:spermidine/putrescine transport system permease protein
MRSSRFAKSGLGIPYALFLLLFVVAPLFVLLYYAFTNGQGQFTVQNLAAFCLSVLNTALVLSVFSMS